MKYEASHHGTARIDQSRWGTALTSGICSGEQFVVGVQFVPVDDMLSVEGYDQGPAIVCATAPPHSMNCG